MTITPEIAVGILVGWWCLSIAVAYFWGKMKRREEDIFYGVHRFRQEERRIKQVLLERDSTSRHST